MSELDSPETVDLHHCPTCGQGFAYCDAPFPPQPDVACRLPRGHRSEDHWHHPLYPGTPALLWWDDEVTPGA